MLSQPSSRDGHQDEACYLINWESRLNAEKKKKKEIGNTFFALSRFSTKCSMRSLTDLGDLLTSLMVTRLDL